MNFGVKLALDWCLSAMDTLAGLLESNGDEDLALKVRKKRLEFRKLVVEEAH
jgi:hypothetical protein